LSVPKSKDPDCGQKPDKPTSPPRAGEDSSGETVEQEPGQSQLMDRHNPDKPPPGDGWYWFPDDSLPNGGEWAHISEFEEVVWYDQEGES